MVNSIALSTLNTVVDYVLFGIGFLSALFILRKLRQFLPKENISSKFTRFKRAFVLFISTVILAVGLFFCIDIIITAIAKNLMVASQGHLPGVSQAEFNSMFPTFDLVAAQAFIFAHFIPIVQYCFIGYSILFLIAELFYWGTHTDKQGTTTHYLFFKKLLHLNTNRVLNVLKSLIFIMIWYLAIPFALWMIFEVNPWHLPGNIFSGGDDIFTYMLWMGIIIGQIYIGYFTSQQVLHQMHIIPEETSASTLSAKTLETSEKNPPSSETTPKNSETLVKNKPKIKLSISALIFVALIVLDFIATLLILFDFTPVRIESSGKLLTSFFQYVIPDANMLSVITRIFILFPIDMTIYLLFSFVFFFRSFFRREFPAQSKKDPKDLFFIAYILVSYVLIFFYNFLVTYPWMYASYFSGTLLEYESTLLLSTKFYFYILVYKFASLGVLVGLAIKYLKKKPNN